MKQIATITVIGEDKTGVVARVTGFCRQAKANIEGLEEQVTRKDFSMTIRKASWKPKAWHRGPGAGRAGEAWAVVAGHP